MLATLISVIFAVFLSFHHIEFPPGFNVNALAAGILLMGAIIGWIIPMLYANIWRSLQKAELTATPRVTELFHSDKTLIYIRTWCLLFPLLMFIVAIDLSLTSFTNKTALLAIAVVLFGVTLDAISYAIKRMSEYLSPTITLNHFIIAAQKSVKEEQYGDVCAWIDAISEVGIQATQSGRLSLTMQVLDNIHDILRHFLKASKSISHHVPTMPETQKGGLDTVSYVLLFAFQRLELMNTTAAKMRLEPICGHISNVLGKIALDAAQYDITVAQYPLLYLGRTTREAISKEVYDVPAKATCALVELAKQVPAKMDLSYLEIAPFYTTIISQLDENAKAIFKNDKSINFNILLQPFEDVKSIFVNSKLADHQDAPVITTAIDNILGQFKTLEDVIKSMTPFGVPDNSAVNIDDEGLSTKIVDDLEQRLRNPKAEEDTQV